MGPGKPGPGYKVNWDVWTPRAIKMLESGNWLVREVAAEIGVSTNCLVGYLSDYRRAHPERQFSWPRIQQVKERR